MNKVSQNILTVGQLIPDISLPTLNGDEINLSDLKGRKVILFMWASW